MIQISAMLKVGLTGGIATGKSTVASLFHEKGAIIVDFDRLAHEAQAPGTDTFKAVIRAFGQHILDESGKIDRRRLGSLVFADAGKRSLLDSIVHPAVFETWRRKADDLAKRDERAIVMADIPLLYETECSHFFDVVVLVYASPQIQIERLTVRNALTRHEAEMRLSAQMPIDEKCTLADYIIDNGGVIEDTKRAVDNLWETLVEAERSIRQNKGDHT